MTAGPAETTPTPTRGVPVLLDRERRFRYTLRTIREITKEFGEGALSMELTGEKLAKVLWHGLKHEDPDLTVEQVEDAIDLENLHEVLDAMKKAMGTKAKAALDAVETARGPLDGAGGATAPAP